jgi:hypothetical protein
MKLFEEYRTEEQGIPNDEKVGPVGVITLVETNFIERRLRRSRTLRQRDSKSFDIIRMVELWWVELGTLKCATQGTMNRITKVD